ERLAPAVDEREIDIEQHRTERVTCRSAAGGCERGRVDRGPPECDARPETDAIAERRIEADAWKKEERRRPWKIDLLASRRLRARRVHELDHAAHREMIRHEDVGRRGDPERRRLDLRSGLPRGERIRLLTVE